jgi:GH15 family glucan-1,4-alpha-glucosidase
MTYAPSAGLVTAPTAALPEQVGGSRAWDYRYTWVIFWVPFDRAVRMATNRGRPADLDRWARERDRIHAQVMTKGWDDQPDAFVQYEGGEVLDASLVLMPLMGFIEEIDPTGQPVGNLPQAFAHLALIAAALNLDRQLNNPKGPAILRPGGMARRG